MLPNLRHSLRNIISNFEISFASCPDSIPLPPDSSHQGKHRIRENAYNVFFFFKLHKNASLNNTVLTLHVLVFIKRNHTVYIFYDLLLHSAFCVRVILCHSHLHPRYTNSGETLAPNRTEQCKWIYLHGWLSHTERWKKQVVGGKSLTRWTNDVLPGVQHSVCNLCIPTHEICAIVCAIPSVLSSSSLILSSVLF